MITVVGILLVVIGLVAGGLVVRAVWSGMVAPEPPPTSAELAALRNAAAAERYASTTPQIQPVRLGRKRVIERTDAARQRRAEEAAQEPE